MDENFRKIATVVIVASLIVLTFLILKPIIIPIVMALVLAFVFSPIYEAIYKKTKNKDISAIIIVVFLIIIIILPLWFATPFLLIQVTNIFQTVSNADIITPLKSVFPQLFVSESISSEIDYALYSFTTKTVNYFSDSLTSFIINFPIILLKLTVVFFTLFFVLKDKDKLKEYIGSLLPFSKDVEKKLFAHTSGITSAILYGHFIVGILQGLIVGIGLFLFQVPNALLFTIISIFAGIFPVVGVFIVWAPVVIYLFASGHLFSAWGMIFLGIIASNVDNLLRPLIVSRKVDISPSLVLISMIGGLFFFGILGVIIGPLVISYLLIILELYRGKPIILLK
ncbi:MAG: AI-2E family transporter [Nanoarchaeota archaeon]|nr:AI-2E family transporter [Nanoarchaeota archaeon]